MKWRCREGAVDEEMITAQNRMSTRVHLGDVEIRDFFLLVGIIHTFVITLQLGFVGMTRALSTHRTGVAC